MIIDDDLLVDKEVLGIQETVEDDASPIPWNFHDDGTVIKFNYSAKNTKYAPIIMTIFNRFCEKHDIVPSSVIITRVTLRVQDSLNRDPYPIIEHNFDHKVFMYFVNDSDALTYVGDNAVEAKAGRAILFDGSQPYMHISPKKNFITTFEVTYLV